MIWIKGGACCGLTVRHTSHCQCSGPMRRVALYPETLIATGVSRAAWAAVIQASTRKEE